MRNRPIRLVAAFAGALVAVTAGPVAQTLACSCAQLGPGEALANAEVAFVGVVARVDDPSGGGPIVSTGDPIIYTFAVEQSLKGGVAVGDAVVVRSARDGASCGTTFALAQRWQVYAYHDPDDVLTTGLCDGNELLAEQAPIPEIESPTPPGPPAELLLAAGAVLLIVVVSGLAFLRGGRRPA